eukprot:scaffold12911_cov67-Phaeocystis_antarctica.AAC.5
MATCSEFRHSRRRRRWLRPSVEWGCRGPAGGAGRRPGRQRGGWPRLQAAADGAALVVVIERAAAALELVIIQQAFLLGPQLLHALFQSPLLLLVLLQDLLLLHPLHVAVAQVHLC